MRYLAPGFKRKLRKSRGLFRFPEVRAGVPWGRPERPDLEVVPKVVEARESKKENPGQANPFSPEISGQTCPSFSPAKESSARTRIGARKDEMATSLFRQ